MNIAHISSHIASAYKSVAELVSSGEISRCEGAIFEKIMGLKNIPRELSLSTVENLQYITALTLHESGTDSYSIRYVIYFHTADYPFPLEMNNLKIILSKFNFKNAQCIGSTFYKCAGLFHGMRLAEKLFRSLSDTDSILLLASDLAFTEILQVIPGATLMGDASVGIVLKKQGVSNQLIDLKIKSLGQFSKGQWADRRDEIAFQSTYVDTVCDLIYQIMAKNNLSLNDLNCIFPHNVNSISWKQVIQKLSLSENQVYLSNISKMAHCFGSDPFINLESGISEGVIQAGDYYLLFTMGLGATFAAGLFQF
jgi:3-oxoacyl-[acyl-carrier-protein] synthase-3